MATIPLLHAAEKVGCSRGLLQRLVSEGALSAERSGRLILIDLEEARQVVAKVRSRDAGRRRRTNQYPGLREAVQLFAEAVGLPLHGATAEDTQSMSDLLDLMQGGSLATPCLLLVEETNLAVSTSARTCRRILNMNALSFMIPLRAVRGQCVSHEIICFQEQNPRQTFYYPSWPMTPTEVATECLDVIVEKLRSFGVLDLAERMAAQHQKRSIPASAPRWSPDLWVTARHQELLASNCRRLDFGYLRFHSEWLHAQEGTPARLGKLLPRHDPVAAGVSPMTLRGASCGYGETRVLMEVGELPDQVPVRSGFKDSLVPEEHPSWLRATDIVIDPCNPARVALSARLLEEAPKNKLLLGPGLYRIRCGSQQEASRLFSAVFELSDAFKSRRLTSFPGQVGAARSFFAVYWSAIAIGSRGRRISTLDLLEMPIPNELLASAGIEPPSL